MTKAHMESILKSVVIICFIAIFYMSDTVTDKLDAVMGIAVFNFLWGPLR